MVADPNAAGPDVSGHLVIGSVMYSTAYAANWWEPETGPVRLTRVGGGWGDFTAFDEALYVPTTGRGRTSAYGLRSDGVLFRWTIAPSGVWQGKTSYPGFAAVKAFAIISETATYDTLLATTRGGALYTIHIPTSTPMHPVVKLVRRTTWQVFESLMVAACGQYGVLLLGVDKNTHSGYLYAVGHATGLSTVIQPRGKLPVSFDDPTYHGWAAPGSPLFGE
ncbi:hypothetical protein GCM10009554_48490 [Kribbella koreensis]